MGSGAASSKNPKNISGEEKRRRKKNPKFRKRRRISSSTSSYSSDSDVVSRDLCRRRRSSRRKTEKRRGREPKRSVTKKSLKARRRSASSSSRDSSSSYSTYRSLSSGGLDKRSRSPFRHKDDRKGKSKIRKRGRKLNRDSRSSRIRNRSPSCPTCSGNISRSSSRKRSYKEEKSLERDGSAHIGLNMRMVASGDEVETYESGGRETNNKMVMENHNDLQLPQVIVDRNVEGVEEEDGAMVQCSYEHAVDIDRWMGEGNVENYSPFTQFEYGAFIKGGEAQISEPYQEFGVNTEVAKRIKSKVVAADNPESESDDLELMLRQKALENLKKLRGGISSDIKTIGDTKNESAGDQSSEQPCETSKKFVNSSESYSIISKQRQIQGGLPSHVPKVDPFNELSSKEAIDSILDRKMVFDVLNQSISKQQDNSKTIAQSTSNQQSSLQDSLDKMSSKQYPYRDSQEKTTTARCESGNGFMNEVSFGDGSGSMNTCTYGEKKINDSNKTVNECQSGSQFEQKSFSRMHDGEMVQVSYKVYIPKKAPALARRKLQR